jgi:hypothetical protein
MGKETKTTKKEKKNRIFSYRKLLYSGKEHKLPKGLYPFLYMKEKETIYIFAVDKDKNYTIIWDGISKFPNEIQWILKAKNDEYEILRKFVKETTKK